jgi:hypothetical protein
MRVNMTITAEEYVLPEGEVIATRMDLKGCIAYADDAFVRGSQFPRDKQLAASTEELAAQPKKPRNAAACGDAWQEF